MSNVLNLSTAATYAAPLFTGLVGLVLKQPAFVPKTLATIAREAKWFGVAFRFWKGARNMNAVEMIPLVVELGDDALVLTQDILAHDKAGAVDAVVKAVPLVARLADKDPAPLVAFVTPERVSMAIDAAVAIEQAKPMIVAVYAKLEAMLAAQTAPSA